MNHSRWSLFLLEIIASRVFFVAKMLLNASGSFRKVSVLHIRFAGVPYGGNLYLRFDEDLGLKPPRLPCWFPFLFRGAEN